MLFLLFYCYYSFNLLIIKYLRMITTNIFMTTKRKKVIQIISYTHYKVSVIPLQRTCNAFTTYL